MPFARSEPIHFGLRIGPQSTGWFKTRRQRIDVSKLDGESQHNVVISPYQCHGHNEGSMHTTSNQRRPRSPHLSMPTAARKGHRRHAETQLARPQPSNIDDSSRKTTLNQQPRSRKPLTPRSIINDGPRHRDHVSKGPITPSEIAPVTFTLCSGRSQHQRARVPFRHIETPSDTAPATFTLCSGREHFSRTNSTHSNSSHRDSKSYSANLLGGRTKIESITEWTKSVAKDSFAGSSSFTRSTLSHSSQAKRLTVNKGYKARDHYPNSYSSNSTSAASHSK